MKTPKLRRNLQVEEPTLEYGPEGNGWPLPLTDPSNPLKMAVTSGSNGSQRNFDPVSTSQQDSGEHHLADGSSLSSAGSLGQGSHSDKLKTSQQNAGGHHAPEGE